MYEYRDKEWLYKEAILLGKTEKQIAEENGWTQRVVVKWIQIFGFGDNNFRYLKRLNPKQQKLVEASLLGDGHITDEGIFIVSHCEKQKDYLYWKYSILSDCCKKQPSYYLGGKTIINNHESNKQPSYRMNTRKINHLKELKELTKVNIIKNLDGFGLSIWFLDDGYRDKWTWDLCLGDKSPEETKAIHEKLAEYGLKYTYRKDARYIRFSNESSRRIDSMILFNIPNNLDIIKYKINKERK